jgi:hypothetical protein
MPLPRQNVARTCPGANDAGQRAPQPSRPKLAGPTATTARFHSRSSRLHLLLRRLLTYHRARGYQKLEAVAAVGRVDSRHPPCLQRQRQLGWSSAALVPPLAGVLTPRVLSQTRLRMNPTELRPSFAHRAAARSSPQCSLSSVLLLLLLLASPRSHHRQFRCQLQDGDLVCLCFAPRRRCGDAACHHHTAASGRRLLLLLLTAPRHDVAAHPTPQHASVATLQRARPSSLPVRSRLLAPPPPIPCPPPSPCLCCQEGRHLPIHQTPLPPPPPACLPIPDRLSCVLDATSCATALRPSGPCYRPPRSQRRSQRRRHSLH